MGERLSIFRRGAADRRVRIENLEIENILVDNLHLARLIAIISSHQEDFERTEQDRYLGVLQCVRKVTRSFHCNFLLFLWDEISFKAV